MMRECSSNYSRSGKSTTTRNDPDVALSGQTPYERLTQNIQDPLS